MESMPQRPRLFTARYANKTLATHPAAKVGITLGPPRFRLSYQLAGKILELAPTREMFGKSEAEFAAAYTALLVERGGIEHLTQRFASVAAETGSDDLVLLCFEDLRTPGLFCHRRVFAAWWTAATKQPVLELPEL
jgi:hypothetical protein